MDPITIGAIANTLFTAGPSLIRGIGSLFGGKTADVANTVADIADTVKGKPNPQQELEKAIQNLPAEAFLELQNISKELEVEMQRIESEREARKFKHAETMHNQTQVTIQNGDNAQGQYVRNTRPKAARLSCYAGITYVLILEILNAFDKGSGASWEVAAMLFTPLLTYMGVRTVDAFSQFKGTKL